MCGWIDITSIMINDALESLVTAVETERADVIQEVVKTVKKCELLTLYFNEWTTRLVTSLVSCMYFIHFDPIAVNSLL